MFVAAKMVRTEFCFLHDRTALFSKRFLAATHLKKDAAADYVNFIGNFRPVKCFIK